MQTTVKSNKEKKMIIFAVVMMFFTGVIVYASGILDGLFASDEAVVTETSQPASEQSAVAAVKPVIATQNTNSGTGEAAMVRMVTAPSFNDVYSAGEIIHRAIDQPEAQRFVETRMTLRAMKIQEEISKLQASDAENKVKKAEANKKLTSLENGGVADSSLAQANGLVPDSNERIPGAINMKKHIDDEFSAAAMQFPESNKEAESEQSVDEEKESKRSKIRLAGFSKSGRFTFQYGSNFVPNAQINQTIFNRFKIASSDLKSKCVVVTDILTKRNENVCYNG